jgi:poly-gamma-glutamate synthesis protein (capsule biosynthesis protein)
VRERLVLTLLVVGTGLLVLFPPRPAAGPVRLAFMGDLMLGRDVARAHADGDWSATAETLQPYLSDVDLAFANLESPLTSAPLTRPALDLRASPQAAATVARLWFDVLSLANNHSLDAGETGVEDTIEALQSAGVAALGPTSAPLTVNLRGVRAAFLAFDDTWEDLDLPSARTAVARARRAAEIVVVSVHWGSELETSPNARQRADARELAGAGADLIVGHGPHVLQEVEWVWGDGRGRPTLVAYSLGNALFDSPAPPAVRQSAVLRVDVGSGGVLSACVIPLLIEPIAWDLAPATADASAGILRSMHSDGARSSPSVSACP